MKSQSSQYGVVLVTTSSSEAAESMARALLTEKLAACVNIVPVDSFYTWQGKINSDREWQLIIKTDLARFVALEAKIKTLHSYEVPEIIALPIIAGSESYLNWLETNLY